MSVLFHHTFLIAQLLYSFNLSSLFLPFLQTPNHLYNSHATKPVLYVDEQFDDVTLFGNVRNCAFKIMPKENIQALGQNMLNKPYRKKEFKWQEIDKAQKSYRKSLRSLFMKLSFSSELTNNPWLKSANWLHQVFTNNQKLSDRPFNECPNDTIPKYLQRYLLASNTEENKIINSNRYEYWVYCQINKQIN